MNRRRHRSARSLGETAFAVLLLATIGISFVALLYAVIDRA